MLGGQVLRRLQTPEKPFRVFRIGGSSLRCCCRFFVRFVVRKAQYISKCVCGAEGRAEADVGRNRLLTDGGKRSATADTLPAGCRHVEAMSACGVGVRRGFEGSIRDNLSGIVWIWRRMTGCSPPTLPMKLGEIGVLECSSARWPGDGPPYQIGFGAADDPTSAPVALPLFPPSSW